MKTKNTPIQKISDFNTNEMYIKREDLIDLSFGGNKARKVEYFMEDILNKKSDYIVTYGSVQSNHCRVVAALSAKMGIKCLLILAETDEIDYGGNYFLYKLYDAKITFSKVDKVSSTIDETIQKLKDDGYNPYFITGGGHGNLGTMAYVDAYKEITNQNKDKEFDYIFFASGTGTTQAGLIIGNEKENSKTKIVGISIARNKKRATEVIYESIKDYCQEYNEDLDIDKININIEDRYIGNGYGHIYEEILSTIKEVSRKDNILLDPVYTGKAFYAMNDYIVKNNIKNKKILFIHTGGMPILFKHADRFKEILDLEE